MYVIYRSFKFWIFLLLIICLPLALMVGFIDVMFSNSNWAILVGILLGILQYPIVIQLLPEGFLYWFKIPMFFSRGLFSIIAYIGFILSYSIKIRPKAKYFKIFIVFWILFFILSLGGCLRYLIH